MSQHVIWIAERFVSLLLAAYIHCDLIRFTISSKTKEFHHDEWGAISAGHDVVRPAFQQGACENLKSLSLPNTSITSAIVCLPDRMS
jgi:hypothetical protein